jgi:hypothetical protein
MTFAERNTLIIKHSDPAEFYKDIELFKKHFPNHKLNKELARANRFTHSRLDGSMLNILLQKIPLSEILANRLGAPGTLGAPVAPATAIDLQSEAARLAAEQEAARLAAELLETEQDNEDLKEQIIDLELDNEDLKERIKQDSQDLKDLKDSKEKDEEQKKKEIQE